MADRDDVGGSTRAPELQEVIRAAFAAAQKRLYTMIPAAVHKVYTGDKGQIIAVDAQPLVRRAYADEEGVRQLEDYAIVVKAPVEFAGAGDFRATWPVVEGTLGRLEFSFLSIKKWLAGRGAAVDPEIDQHHPFSDAVFVPGLRAFGAAWSSAPNDHATIGADDGVQVHMRRDHVTVADDEAGADFVGLAQKIMDNFNALKSHFSVIEAIIAGPPIPEPGMGAPSAFQAALALAITTPPNPYPDVEAVAASQLKAK